jgi:hypothetical protein
VFNERANGLAARGRSKLRSIRNGFTALISTRLRVVPVEHCEYRDRFLFHQGKRKRKDLKSVEVQALFDTSNHFVIFLLRVTALGF